MSFTTHLTELMEQRKAKYLPFLSEDRPSYAGKLSEAVGLVFRAVLIIGLLALVVCVS